MEEPIREAPTGDEWRTKLAESIASRRQRARAVLQQERSRLKQVEQQFTARVQELSDRIAAEERQVELATQELTLLEAAASERAQSLDERRREAEALQRALEKTQAEAAQHQEQMLAELNGRLQELASRQAALDAANEALQARQQALADGESDFARRTAEVERSSVEIEHRSAELERQAAEFGRQASDLQQQQAEIDQLRAAHQADVELLESQLLEYRELRQQLADRELETQKQRRHIAQQLRARKQELAAAVELHRAESLASAAGEELQLQMRLSELQSRHERMRDDLSQREQALEQARQEAASLAAQAQARQAELDQQRQATRSLESRIGELESERDRAAVELSAARSRSDVAAEKEQAELRAQLAQAAAELNDCRAELQLVREDAVRQHEAVKAAAAVSIGQQAGELKAEIERLQSERSSRVQEAAAREVHWREQVARLERELSEQKSQLATGAGATAELKKLREENKQLEAWLAESEEKIKQAGAASAGDQDDLRRRFEMAVADVRELKTKNAELCEQLAKAKAAGSAAPANSLGGALDWEAQKRRLLEQLEADFDPADNQQSQDKLTVEGAIRITDQIVADKESEIEELRRLLQHQSDNIGEVAVGAAAIASMFDSDELICQERENLRQMQESLREQLRKAEVDISLERAKLARERAELDEKLQSLTADIAKHSLPGAALADKFSDKKPARGRWLARLGLKEGDPE